MEIKKLLSTMGILTLAACSGGNESELALQKRSIEERCLKLEQNWDQAQQALVAAENRQQSSWLYHVADSFNPLTSSRNGSYKIAKQQEMRTRENYFASGCAEFNRMQIKYDFKPEEPKQNSVQETEKKNYYKTEASNNKAFNSYADNSGYMMNAYAGY